MSRLPRLKSETNGQWEKKKKKWKMVNSHVLEPSKSKPSWWMCTVGAIHKKYRQTIIIMFVKKDQSCLEFENFYIL